MTKRTAAVVLVIGIAALTAVLVWVIAGSGPVWNWNSSGAWQPADTEVYRQQMPASDIKNIETDLRSEDLRITAGRSDMVEVVQYGPRQGLDSKYIVNAEVSGGTLRVWIPDGVHSSFIWGVIPQTRVDILVPKELKGYIDAEASSGYVEVNGTRASEVEVRTSSGDIDITEVGAGTVNAEASSGFINLKSVNADAITTRTTSGDVQADDIKTGTLDLTATSGFVSVQGNSSADAASVSTTSGDADCRFKKISEYRRTCTSGYTDITVLDAASLKSVYAEATSGDVTIRLPAGTEVSADLSTSSGDTFFGRQGEGGLVISGTGIPVTASTTSGSITLETD